MPLSAAEILHETGIPKIGVVLFGEVNYQRPRSHTNSKLMFVTQGSPGVVVVDDRDELPVPAFQVADPVDISGAGGSFSAAAALALAITGSPLDASRFGNLVASISLRKRGEGFASPTEFVAAAREVSFARPISTPHEHPGN